MKINWKLFAIVVSHFFFLMEYTTNQFIETSGIWLLKSLCLGLIYKDIFCLDGCKRSFMVCPVYLSTDSIVPHNIYLPQNRVKRVCGSPLSFVLWQQASKHLQSTRPKNRLRWEMYETTFWGLPIYRHSRSGVYCLCPRIDRKGQGPRPPNPQGLRGPNREPTRKINPRLLFGGVLSKALIFRCDSISSTNASESVDPLVTRTFRFSLCWLLMSLDPYMKRS